MYFITQEFTDAASFDDSVYIFRVQHPVIAETHII